MTAQVRYLNPPTIATPRGYTHVVEVTNGKMIFISGQVAFDQAGNLVGVGDLRAQTQQVFENLKAALVAVGADFSHVVKLNNYFVDISGIQDFRDVRDQYVNTANPPASTAVEVTRLFREGFLVEVEAVAILPE